MKKQALQKKKAHKKSINESSELKFKKMNRPAQLEKKDNDIISHQQSRSHLSKQSNRDSEEPFLSISQTYEKYIKLNKSLKQPFQSFNSIIPKKCLKCICNKTFQSKLGFLFHTSAKHDCSIEKRIFEHIRQQLIKNGHKVQDYLTVYSGYINIIRTSPNHLFRPPEQLTDIFSDDFTTSLQKKIGQINLVDFVLAESIFSNRKANQKDQSKWPLTHHFINKIRIISIKFIRNFSRNYEILLKNMSISEIIHVFLFSLATKASPMIKSDIFLKIFQLLESIIKRFLNWIDINYTSVFKFNNIFYQHIEIRAGQSYTQSQRTWNINLFISHYRSIISAQISDKSTNQIFTFFFSAFQQYIKLKKLDL